MIDAEWIFNEILKLLNSYYGIYSKPINGTLKIFIENFREQFMRNWVEQLVKCIAQAIKTNFLSMSLHHANQKCQFEN